MELPRPYISYSAWKLWRTSKTQYRKRYYENEKSFETIETIFGKKIADLLETNDPSVAHIPNYAGKERKVEKEIEGTMVMGRLDGFNEEKIKFLDHKSGHADKDGKPPWSRLKVHKLDQLPFYSMLLKEIHGRVENVCHLIWIETAFKDKTIEWNGHTLKTQSRELIMTGRVKKYRRVIREWERKRIKEDLLKAINEIKSDYENWKKSKQGVEQVSLQEHEKVA